MAFSAAIRRAALVAGAALLFLPPAPAVAQTILINQLTDMPMGTWDGVSNMTLTIDHCVGTTGSRPFRITIRGTGPGDSFRLSNGISALPFTVFYKGRTGSLTQVSAGTPLTGLVGNTRAQCVNLSRQNEQLRVTLAATDLAAATAGSYSGTLTLTVAPE